jgi:hypothetical protein
MCVIAKSSTDKEERISGADIRQLVQQSDISIFMIVSSMPS